MDEELKRVAEAADRFVNGLDPRGGEVRVSVPALKLHFERTLSAAADRERELVEDLTNMCAVIRKMNDEYERDEDGDYAALNGCIEELAEMADALTPHRRT